VVILDDERAQRVAKGMFAHYGLRILCEGSLAAAPSSAWVGRIGDRFVVALPGGPDVTDEAARALLAPILTGLAGRPFQTSDV
jgi:hypothetical protein